MVRKPKTVPSALHAPSAAEPRQAMTHVVRICQADLANPSHAQALLTLLDGYARDPMGGSKPLSAFAKGNLISAMQTRPYMFSVLAFDESQGDLPVGLINCVEGFSTFACQPLVNVHDVVVLGSHRGAHLGQRMLQLVAELAAQRGACKLTLEVLEKNMAAMTLYKRFGFEHYQLDPEMGHAQFMQKWL